MRDVFNALARILHIHISRVDISFAEQGGIGRLAFGWPAMTAPKIQLNSFYLASLVLRLRTVAGSGWLPLSVDFEHRQPADLTDYHRLFGTRLTFDAPRNVVIVDANTLSKRKAELMEGLHENLVELGVRRLKEQFVATTVSERLKLLLTQHLASELPFNLDAMSTGLEIPSRALQWRLGQEGTSYERILLDTRRTEAISYLRDSAHPLTRVAELLGFSELSAFTRWTQKHYRMTPSALRQHLRAGEQPDDSAADNPP